MPAAGSYRCSRRVSTNRGSDQQRSEPVLHQDTCMELVLMVSDAHPLESIGTILPLVCGSRSRRLSPRPWQIKFMISVNELTRHFRSNGGTLVAVDKLTFQVKSGEVYGLLGPNGAGKTTTLRMILGLLAPTSGDAVVQGFRATSQPDEVKRRIGLV